MWPGLRTALNTERAAELGTQIAEGKKSAPTRPHPHTLPSPGALKAAGPVAALADKARDKVTGAATDPARRKNRSRECPPGGRG